MRRWLLALCDVDESYMYKFVEYLEEKKRNFFDIHSFSSQELIQEYALENEIDILLISNRAITKETFSENIKRIIILYEEGVNNFLYDYPCINKFQSAENVIKEVMDYYISEEKEAGGKRHIFNKKTEIIGVYSPIGRCYKTSFAIVRGIIESRQKKVLYINLEDFSGLTSIFNFSSERDLSDLMYFYKQNNNINEKLYSMIDSFYGLDMIPPVAFSRDIRNEDTLEWIQFIHSVAEESDYEEIILDISNMISNVVNILEICDRVYMPVLKDEVSILKVREFEECIRKLNKDEVIDKTIKLKLPVQDISAYGEDYYMGLAEGNFGKYVMSM